MAVKQWQSDSLIQLVILLNGNNKIYHDAFCFYLFTYRLVFLCDVWRLSDAFPCHIYLCLETDERGEGWGLERGIIEVFASVYVCVWVSLSLLSITPITASHFILVTTLARSPSFPFHPTCLTLSNSESTIQVSPTFPSPSLYTCQTFTLLPVFVLQSGFWRSPSGRRGRGKPIRWGADGRSFWAAKKERLWYWFQDFPLEPRRLCKLYLEEVCFKCTCCAITQTAFERRRCVLVCELFLSFLVSACFRDCDQIQSALQVSHVTRVLCFQKLGFKWQPSPVSASLSNQTH